MKLKNIKVGETYIIKSLDHTAVGDAPFKIGDKVEVIELTDYHDNSIRVYGGWVISHKDLKRANDESPIQYSRPLQEHLGKEVEVVESGFSGVESGFSGVGSGKRGFVVSLSNKSGCLLIDFGIGFYGHGGNGSAVHPQANPTCWYMRVDKLRFLTEDDE